MPVVGSGRIEPISGQISYTGGSSPSAFASGNTSTTSSSNGTSLNITGDVVGSGWPNITANLTFTGVTAGTYSLTTLVVDSKGRISYVVSGTSGNSLTPGNGISITSGTITLSNTSVSPGTYTLSTVVVDAQGRITSASNGITNGVSSLSAGIGLTGGTITSSGTIGLNNTGVSSGTYTLPTLVIDAQGRISSAVNGVVPPSIPLTFFIFASEPSTNGTTLYRFKVKEAFRLEFANIQSVAISETPTTTSAIFDVYRNNIAIGNFTFGAADQEADFQFIGSSNIDFSVNDTFSLRTNTTDATITNIGFTIVGVRL